MDGVVRFGNPINIILMSPVIVATCLTGLLPFSTALCQLEPFGLEGEHVTSLSLFSKWGSRWESAVCAGTDSSGVFVRETASPGSRWVNLGLEEKRVTALHVHHSGVGPMDFDTIIAGVRPDKTSGDSTLLYSYTYGFDSTWAPCDIGLDVDSLDCVRTISGYAYTGHYPPQPLFVGDGGAIYRSYSVELGGYWEKVWFLDGDTRVNVIHIAKDWPCCSPLWAGGETDDSEPFLVKTLDKGETWEVFYPDLGVKNTIYSIAYHPDYPNTVYAGLKNTIIKTTDGGETWTATHYYGYPISYFGLVIDPSNPEHVFAGGTVSENSFALYESFDGGEYWIKILPEKIPESEVAGITSLVVDTLNEQCILYIGTSGSGVFMYRSEMSDVNESERSIIPDKFSLHQNYPNPFNAVTDIRYQIAALPHVGDRIGNGRSSVHTAFRIYNVLGQEVKTLVDEPKDPGYYSVTWDGRDGQGGDVPSGVYFYRLSVNESKWAETRKMVLVR